MDRAACGAFMARLRRERGWTQKELAEKLYVTDKAVSKWERGLSMPDSALLLPLAEALGVSVTELLQGRRMEAGEALSRERVEDLVQETFLRWLDHYPGQREREALRQGAERSADWLEDLGLLNDEEYAGTVARHYAAKGYGLRKIQDELYRRGVPRDHWAQAMDGIERADSALDGLLQRRMRGAEPTRDNLKKASDYLARRGFSWEEISEAIERYRRSAEE